MTPYVFRTDDRHDRCESAELVLRIYNEDNILPHVTLAEFLSKLGARYHWAVARDSIVVGAKFYTIENGKGSFVDIAVHPDYRRQGIAKEMTDIAIRQMRSHGVKAVLANGVLNAHWEKYLRGIGFEGGGPGFETFRLDL